MSLYRIDPGSFELDAAIGATAPETGSLFADLAGPESAVELAISGARPGDRISLDLFDAGAYLGGVQFDATDGPAAFASAAPFDRVELTVNAGAPAVELVAVGSAGPAAGVPGPTGAALLGLGLAVAYLARKCRATRPARGATQRTARPTVASRSEAPSLAK